LQAGFERRGFQPCRWALHHLNDDLHFASSGSGVLQQNLTHAFFPDIA
jgi:hypothetical protein